MKLSQKSAVKTNTLAAATTAVLIFVDYIATQFAVYQSSRVATIVFVSQDTSNVLGNTAFRLKIARRSSLSSTT
jgi:hypothetical protein